MPKFRRPSKRKFSIRRQPNSKRISTENLRRRFFSAFSKIKLKKKSAGPKLTRARRKSKRSINVQFLIKPILATLIILFSYYGIKSVIQLRKDSASIAGVLTTDEKVFGFEIPIYPESEFIFKDYLDNDEVKEFLTQGKAVYRLPLNTHYSDVTDYYAEILPQLGWELVQSVPLGTEEMKYGDYWKKENEAIRIYSEINDVWYQKISIKEAEQGLSEVVKKEVEREIVISSASGTELLPDYPWILKVPKEYLVSYYPSQFKEKRGVLFKKLGSSEYVLLEPIGTIDTPFDTSLERFLQDFAERKDEDLKPKRWDIVNSAYTVVADRTTLEASLVSGGKNSTAYVIGNSRDSYAYVVTAFKSKSSLVEFILDNIKEKKSAYTQEDFEF